MNIFAVDSNPIIAAQSLCDKHVVKMVLETAQLLCSPHRNAPYRLTHYNHPCAIWVRQSEGNHLWALVHGLSLAREYTLRYEKVHSCEEVLRWCGRNWQKLRLDPRTMPDAPPMMMPETYRSHPSAGWDGVVAAYRRYYSREKRRIARWERGRQAPSWWVEHT